MRRWNEAGGEGGGTLDFLIDVLVEYTRYQYVRDSDKAKRPNLSLTTLAVRCRWYLSNKETRKFSLGLVGLRLR